MTQRKEITDRRTCTRCEIEQDIEEYYLKKRKDGSTRPHSICRTCCSVENNLNRIKNVGDDYLLIKKLPGQYHNQEEKDELFNFMKTILNWEYNDELDLWFREPVKHKSGQWNFQDGKPIVPEIVNVKSHGRRISSEIRARVKELLALGVLPVIIAQRVNICVQTVYSIRREKE